MEPRLLIDKWRVLSKNLNWVNIKQENLNDLGGVAQLVRASSPCTKVVDFIPGQGMYTQESTNECLNKWNN